jgi:integrative and conjugative element protein (TIGR02256 family)
MTWWFKRYPEILKSETNELSTNSNYSQKFLERDNLLVSCGEILIRLEKTQRYPVLIVYHPATPFILPSVFVLKILLLDNEVKEIAAMEYSRISVFLKDKVDFLYLRHQGSDGRICLLEQDNIDMSGITFFSANQVINRVREWISGTVTGNFPKDSSEVELFSHFKNQNHNLNILYTEMFLNQNYSSGIFYTALISNLSKIYYGAFIDGQNKAGIFIPPEKNEIPYIKMLTGISNYEELTNHTEKLNCLINEGEILKGYWWDIENEPTNFKSLDEFISIVGNGKYILGLNRIHNTMQEEFKLLNDEIFIGLRYINRRKELEWQFFRFVKKGNIEPVMGNLDMDHVRELMDSFEIEAIYSEPFYDKHFHKRNNILANRNILINHKINIIGCGALGGEVADNISKAGIGNINLIDKDIIKANNVIRHLASLQFIGIPKTSAVRYIIANHNPFVNIEFLNVDITQVSVNSYLLEDSISVSSIADDNIESLLNEQAVINNKTIFYSRVLRGGKAGRIFRVIPGKDACFNCLLLYKKENNGIFKNIPEDKDLPTIMNECNNPIRPASASEIKLIASLTSKVIINQLQNETNPFNHWIWVTEPLDEFRFSENESMKLFSEFIPPHPHCPYCRKEDPLEVSLPKSILDFMLKETKKSPDIETGGVLIGHKNENGLLFISFASEPGINAKKEKSGFSKDIEYCQRILDEFYENSGGKDIYLGEWHYHPCNNNNPSNTDLKSLSEISSNKEYITTKPIMIILSNEGNASCSVHPIDKKYYKTEIKITKI